MRATRIIMGLPVTVEIIDKASPDVMAAVFALFEEEDQRFSLFKPQSELSRFNRGEIAQAELSAEVQEVFALAETTRQESNGYFNMKRPDGLIDPSGIVKGWVIKRAAALLAANGIQNFYVDAGGDIQSAGRNAENEQWRVGIRSPFALSDIIKVVEPRGKGIATSGNYIRGAHIWNPKAPQESLDDVVSITVIGPDVLEADRFATAAFAMGAEGVHFIAAMPGLEAYQVNAAGRAVFTTGFEGYVA
jgi:FAD:protein FMN transferase